MMRLRGRFTWWFLVVAMVPIAAAALASQFILERGYNDTFERRRQSALATAQFLQRELEVGVVEQVMQLARRDESLAKDYFYALDHPDIDANERQRQLQRQTRGRMEDRLLDVLYYIDRNGQVVFSGHLEGLAATFDKTRAAADREILGKAVYRTERVDADSSVRQALVVLTAAVVREEVHEALVVAGRELGRSVLAPIQRQEYIDARIVDEHGAVLMAPLASWGAENISRIPLRGASGDPVAFLEISVADADLTALTGQLRFLTIVIGIAAILFTTLIAFWVARTMTRSLDTLVYAAQRVAQDQLDEEVKVGRRQDEIAELAMAFNKMMGDLQDSKQRLVLAERVAAWQEIARRLAHEIKNPLTPIQMSIETLRKTRAKQHPSFDEVFEESTTTVLEETDRLKRIVAEFTEFARLPKPKLELADLNEIVSKNTVLYEASGQVERALADDLPPLLVDRDQLSQALLNLIENARDAIGGAPGGRVVVSTARRGDRVELRVDDNGPGVDPGATAKLFTPYYTTKHSSGGTGLGLAIVHRIVVDHKGSLTVSQSDLGGARFTIVFPAPPKTPA